MPQTPDLILRELQGSVLFAPDYPRRIRYSNEELASLATAALEEWRRPQKAALERAGPSWKSLVALVRSLGEARYEPAIPTLAQIWRDCALAPARVAAGHALRMMSTEEARRALASMIDDSDQLSVALAVRAVFEGGPARAYDYFEPRFAAAPPASPVVASAALRFLAPSSFRIVDGKQVPAWTEPRAPEWLRQDPRWLDLAARLRRDEVFGNAARTVLRYALPEDRAAALARVRKAEVPQPPPRRTGRAGNLLARYRAGEFDAVWQDIRSHPDIGGDFLAEVSEVAVETMRRVARNADLLADRLRVRGWRPLFGQFRIAPSPDDRSIIERIETITGGPVPPSLRAFWAVVGGIDFVWDYNSEDPVPGLGVGLAMDEMDPLCVEPASFAQHLFGHWEEQRNEPDPDLVDPFQLDLAPDHLHKANTSGGPPYAVMLPFPGADPVFANERHNLPFVDYLRLAFRWAGFPGLDEHGARDDAQAFVRNFGAGLEPF